MVQIRVRHSKCLNKEDQPHPPQCTSPAGQVQFMGSHPYIYTQGVKTHIYIGTLHQLSSRVLASSSRQNRAVDTHSVGRVMLEEDGRCHWGLSIGPHAQSLSKMEPTGVAQLHRSFCVATCAAGGIILVIMGPTDPAGAPWIQGQ